MLGFVAFFFFSSRRRHTRFDCDWSSDVCSSDLAVLLPEDAAFPPLLSEVPDPPALLFAWGDTALLARPSAGILGRRGHSPHGAPAARLLAARVAGARVVAVVRLAAGHHRVAPYGS